MDSRPIGARCGIRARLAGAHNSERSGLDRAIRYLYLRCAGLACARERRVARIGAHGLTIDPITAGVIRSALLYASEEMGIAVRNSAFSPNIKERLDHSCALFDRDA